MAFNFREALGTPVDDIERPKCLPKGHYYATVPTPGYEYGETRGNGTPYVRFTFSNLRPGPDINPDELDGIDMGAKNQRLDMWCTPKALDRLDRMLDAVLGENTNKRTIIERLPDVNGVEVMIGLNPRFNEDGTDSGYNDVTSCVMKPDEEDE